MQNSYKIPANLTFNKSFSARLNQRTRSTFNSTPAGNTCFTGNKYIKTKDQEVFFKVETIITKYKNLLSLDSNYHRCPSEFRSLLKEIVAIVADSANPLLKNQIATEIVDLIYYLASRGPQKSGIFCNMTPYDELAIVMCGELVIAKYSVTSGRSLRDILNIDYIMEKCNKDGYLNWAANSIKGKDSNRKLSDIAQRHGAPEWGIISLLSSYGLITQ